MNFVLNNNEENVDSNDYFKKTKFPKVVNNNSKIMKKNNLVLSTGKLQNNNLSNPALSSPANNVSICNFPYNTFQYHLKAENGYVAYHVLKMGGSEVTNCLNFETRNNNSKNLEEIKTFSKTDEYLNSLSKQKNLISFENAKDKDEKRRATHNEIERRRRDKINGWMIKLSKIVPQLNDDSTKQAQSKGKILAKTYDYIQDLVKNKINSEEVLEKNENLKNELIECNKKIHDLNVEINTLKIMLLEKNDYTKILKKVSRTQF